MEIWKASCLGMEVSNLGNVRTKRGPKKKTLRSCGYEIVSIKVKGKAYTRYVHRLVASAFLGDGEVVNHKDGIKNNNNLSNLEWTTQAENVQHAINTLGVSMVRNTKGSKNGRAKLNLDIANDIRDSIANGSTQSSQAKLYKISPSTINDIVHNRKWVA